MTDIKNNVLIKLIKLFKLFNRRLKFFHPDPNEMDMLYVIIMVSQHYCDIKRMNCLNMGIFVIKKNPNFILRKLFKIS